MVFDIQTTTIQAILDAKETADNAVLKLRTVWKEKEQAFLADCNRIDNALSAERESLRSEVAELNQTIKRLSGQLAAGVAGTEKIDRDVKENLRKLIRDATARRDEAQATLDGLAEVRPEYSRELYDAACAAAEDFKTALRGDYAETCISIRETAESLARQAEQTAEEVGNRVSFRDDEELARMYRRFNNQATENQTKPAVLPDPVRMLGEPMRKPAYLDEQRPEPKYAKGAKQIVYINGKKYTMPIPEGVPVTDKVNVTFAEKERPGTTGNL